MFGICVYLKKKSCTYVPQINFLFRTKIKKMHNISLRCSLNLNTHPFYSLTVWPNPCTPSSPSMPQSIHDSAELDGRRLSLTVVGLRSKIQPEIEVESPPTQHCRPSPPRSRFESHFHPVNGFWFLFYVFVFHLQIGKTHFCLELVCCWDGAFVYNPNIDAVHCRNL